MKANNLPSFLKSICGSFFLAWIFSTNSWFLLLFLRPTEGKKKTCPEHITQPRCKAKKPRWSQRENLCQLGLSWMNTMAIFAVKFPREGLKTKYTKSLVNTNLVNTNFTNKHFQKVPIPHLTRTMKQKFLH